MSDSRLAIGAVEWKPWPVTLRRPFVTARGVKTVSRNLLVTLRLADGSTGIGEGSESLAWPEETQTAMRRCLSRLIPRLRRCSIPDAWRAIHAAWKTPWASPAALSALECALAAAQARAARQPLWRSLARQLGRIPARPIAVQTSMTISAWSPAVAGRAAAQAAAQRFNRLKVKVTGANPDEDLARLLAVHRAAPRAELIVDANQAFSARGAIAFARALQMLRLPVMLFEQPVARDDLDGLAAVTRTAGLPIAADESVRTVDDARRILARRAAHVLVLKLAKSGLVGTLAIIRMARRARRPLMLSCMAESAIGLTPSVHLACGTGAFRYVDLDSHLLARGQRAAAGFTTRGAILTVR